MTGVKAVFSTAILDNQGGKIGSMLVMAADSREDLEAWRRVAPYALEDVWHELTAHPCQVGPAFSQLGQPVDR